MIKTLNNRIQAYYLSTDIRAVYKICHGKILEVKWLTEAANKLKVVLDKIVLLWEVKEAQKLVASIHDAIGLLQKSRDEENGPFNIWSLSTVHKQLVSGIIWVKRYLRNYEILPTEATASYPRSTRQISI